MNQTEKFTLEEYVKDYVEKEKIMYDKSKWRIISRDHITLSATIKIINKFNVKEKRDRANCSLYEWRLPTPEELENLPEKAAYMNNLNLSSRTFYWTNCTNDIDKNLQMVTRPCCGENRHNNRHYFQAERKKAFSEQEEIYAVATCLP